MANNQRDLLGAWASAGQQEDVETLLQGIQTYLPDASITFTQGCSLEGIELQDFSEAVDAVQDADVIILAIGESAAMSGEAHSRTHLDLPGHQQQLLDALTVMGKPMVAVLMCGRPLVIPQVTEQVDSMLLAWHGGVRSGQAIADILFGAYNPSGKLSISWPRTEGQIPVYYAHKNTGRPAEGHGTVQFHESFRSTYLDELNSPAFCFGYGLSYTQFEYVNLEVVTPTLYLDGKLVVSATVKNVGKQAGVEIVQLYVRDMVGSVTRPVKELKGFLRVKLEPGELQLVRFEVPVRELGFTGPEMQYIVEPGRFKVWIGPDAENGLVGEFEVLP
jgi:beta-glucosidase